MSRSGYVDECDDNWALICYRGAVNSGIKGKRGQEFLIELRDCLERMEDKELVAGELEADGKYCALGVIGKNRGVDMTNINTNSTYQLSEKFNISKALVAEIMFINDEDFSYREETPENRYKIVYNWVTSNIKKENQNELNN